jgi:hypothetical protein
MGNDRQNRVPKNRSQFAGFTGVLARGGVRVANLRQPSRPKTARGLASTDMEVCLGRGFVVG